MESLTGWQIAVNLALIVSPIVIAVGFGFAWLQLASMRKARMAELVMLLFAQWSSPQMVKARQSVCISGSDLQADFEVADKNNDEKFFSDYTAVSNFFDTLGVLVYERYLDCAIAFDTFGKAEKFYHGLYESIITAAGFKGNLSYFIRLHELFIQEEECRSKKKNRHAV